MNVKYRVTINVGINVFGFDGEDAVSAAYAIVDDLLSVLPDVHDVQLLESGWHKMPEESDEHKGDRNG
jgi:hypothetical protein